MVNLAEDDEGRFSPKRQLDLYKALIKSGNVGEMISRYDTQPQLPPISSSYPQADRAADALRIQRDADCLRLYVSTLSKEGLTDILAERMDSLMTHSSLSALSSPPSSRLTGSSNSSISSNIPKSSEYQEHIAQANWPAIHRAVASQQRSSSGRPIRVGTVGRIFPLSPSSALPPLEQQGGPFSSSATKPIKIAISETWSWSKFTRQMASNIVVGLLFMTGISVLFEQQGILKGGITSAEVEPLGDDGKIVTFDDVQGVDEAKQELEEIVEFLKEPQKFTKVGGKLPKGILLYGPPGTGKTHLARAVAGEAGVPFFQMSGSEFDEMYVGVGAKRVRELFAAAKKKAPCIVFIDELDAVGSKRNAKDQSYMRQTLNQLLVELDGFSANEGVIFIAATNTPDSLDKALIRPGRFDRHVPVPLPDVQGRTKILQVHMRNVASAKDVKPQMIARGTPGFSGADLANLVNIAALRASASSRSVITTDDLEHAKDKIMMGAERRSAVITEKNKRLTAYHEGGHALVTLLTPGATPLHKVTVIPRGTALGVTVQLPEEDQSNYTRRELLAMLDVCMGGRVAEMMVFGNDEVTTGASSDLEKASSVARGMVTRYGMSDLCGPVAIGDDDWSRLGGAARDRIEGEVKKMLEESQSRALSMLKKHRLELDRLAEALVEHETLTVDEVKAVIKGEPLR